MNTVIKKMKFAGLALAVTGAFICLTAATVKMLSADFSGQWTLNTGKSEMGQYGGRMAANKIKVTADAAGMSIDRTLNGQNGEMTTTDKLTFDGKESSSPFFGTNVKKSITKWSDDGKSLIVTWTASVEYNGNVNVLKGADTWSLSADGNTLTIASTTAFGGNDIKTSLVYDKAK